MRKPIYFEWDADVIKFHTSYLRKELALLVIFICIPLYYHSSRVYTSERITSNDQSQTGMIDHIRRSWEPFCRISFPAAFIARLTVPLRDTRVLFAAFCEKFAARKPTWSMSPVLRFGASWAPCSSAFARGRARRMDGIGLFHFCTECQSIIRFYERHVKWTFSSLLLQKLSGDIVYAQAKIK